MNELLSNAAELDQIATDMRAMEGRFLRGSSTLHMDMEDAAAFASAS